MEFAPIPFLKRIGSSFFIYLDWNKIPVFNNIE